MSPKARAWPAGSKRTVTFAPASRSIAASRWAFSFGTIGSCSPEERSTRVCDRSGSCGRHERDHRAKQDRAGQHFGPEEQNCRGNVRAIGITDRGHALRIEFISRRGGDHKISQFVRAADDVFFIEDAFSQAPEKSRHAVFEDLAARTEQRRGWIEIAAERNHVVFIAAGSMQEQESALGRPRRWNKAMNEIHSAQSRIQGAAVSNRRFHKWAVSNRPSLGSRHTLY